MTTTGLDARCGSAIGRAFTRGDTVAEVKVDPLEFEAGRAAVTPPGATQLQRVADFLRASPFVGLAVHPLVTEDDLRTLRAQELAAAIQGMQRAAGGTADAVVLTLYSQAFPDRPLPQRVDEAARALREHQTVPESAIQSLASRRVTTTRQMLIDAAGIEPGRIVESRQPVVAGGAGAPRVEFQLVPVGS